MQTSDYLPVDTPTTTTGAESLVSSGTVEALMQVVNWKATEPSSITFVTRAVRVLDLITNIDVSAFHGQDGWQKLLARLEVSSCLHCE